MYQGAEMQVGNVTHSQLTRHVRIADPELMEQDMDTTDRDALLLTQALRTAQSAPDVRMEKVAALKSRVDAGTYAIDTMSLARALVREEPGLFVR